MKRVQYYGMRYKINLKHDELCVVHDGINFLSVIEIRH
jgi:hypothetical protein